MHTHWWCCCLYGDRRCSPLWPRQRALQPGPPSCPSSGGSCDSPSRRPYPHVKPVGCSTLTHTWYTSPLQSSRRLLLNYPSLFTPSLPPSFTTHPDSVIAKCELQSAEADELVSASLSVLLAPVQPCSTQLEAAASLIPTHTSVLTHPHYIQRDFHYISSTFPNWIDAVLLTWGYVLFMCVTVYQLVFTSYSKHPGGPETWTWEPLQEILTLQLLLSQLPKTISLQNVHKQSHTHKVDPKWLNM